MPTETYGFRATQAIGRRTIRQFFLTVAALFLSAVSAFAQVDWLVQLSDNGFDPYPAGGIVQYEAKVSNNGFDPAGATTVSIDLPAGTEFISATGALTNCTAVPTVGPTTVICDVPPLASLESAASLIDVSIPMSGFYSLIATVPTAGDADPGNNSNPQDTTVTAGADIALTVATAASAASGSMLDVTFTATNNGPDDASDMILTVPVPPGYSNITPPAGCSLVGSNYECNVGPIAKGAAVDLIFMGQVSAAGGSDITFVGDIGSVDPGDPVVTNNTAIADVAITGGTDVSIGKSRSPAGTLLVGDDITWTLTSQYTGDSPDTIVITDSVPANYDITSVTPAGGSGWACTVAGQDIRCELASGSVSGANIDLGDIVIVAEIVSSGAPFNVVDITAASPVDPVSSNNSDDDGGVVIEDPVVDLRVFKTGPEPRLAVVGDDYQFTISATNEGNADFFGTLVLTDDIPAGLTVNAITGNGFTCTPNTAPLVGPVTVVCELVYTEASPLSPGDLTPTVVFDTTVTQTGAINNTVNVSSPDANIEDMNGPNDTVSFGVDSTDPSNSADVGVIKSVDLASIPAGDVLTFTLEVTNDGPQPATNVELSDNFLTLINDDEGPDEGYRSEIFTSGAASGIVCSNSDSGQRSRRLNCTIANLPICTASVDCPVFNIEVRPGGNAGGRTNTAIAFSQEVPDPTLDNNRDTVPYAVEARADVTVTKSATPSPVAAGQDVTYVITARNLGNGLSRSDDVIVTDTLPADMTFVSATPSSGSCSVTPIAGTVTQSASNNVVTCELGNIGNGGQRTVTVVARPNIELLSQTVVNNVVVSTSTIETDGTNNTAQAPITIEDPSLDILVNKTDTVDPVAIGDPTEYVITVTNAGPSASQNVVVTDSLPTARLTYQSVFIDPAEGACGTEPAVGSTGGTLICQIPYMEAGQSIDVRVTMEGSAKGSIINNVAITSDEIDLGFDRISGNNQTTENTTIRTRTDIEAVSKVPTPAVVNLNDDFIFTALIRVNTGPGLFEADDVEVTDTLPSNMVLTGTPTVNVVSGSASAMTCTGAAGGTSFTCDLGTVSLGGEVEIEIPVEVVSVSSMPQTFTNSFSVSTSSRDIDPDNNTAMGDVMVGSSSLAGTIFRDFADDSNITPGDTGIGGITVTLMGTTFDGRPIMMTTTTNPDGTYMFDFIPSGTYKVVRDPVTEPHLTQGTNTVGDSPLGTMSGSLSGDDTIEGINIAANTDAVDYDFAFIPQARVGIAKQLSGPVVQADDGSFIATFDFVVENLSLEAFSDLDVTDPLAGPQPLFGSFVSLADPVNDPMAFNTYTVSTAPSGSCGGNVAGYTGDAGGLALIQDATLASGASCTISVSIRVMPSSTTPAGFENQATVDATGALSGQTSATNPDLTDLSNDGATADPDGNGLAGDAGEDTPTPVLPVYSPSIALVKIADRSALSDPIVEDDILTYTFEIRNTGNVTLTNITISDPLIGLTLNNNLIASLAPGDTDTMTITGTYSLTQVDVDAGFVENQATVEGTDPFDTVVDDPSGTTFTDDAPLITTLADTPAVAIIKTSDNSAFQSPPRPGDVITYAFEVRNTGNVTLTNVTVTDSLMGIMLVGSPIPTMSPGDVDAATYTATYEITQDDINAGFVENQAVVTGTPPMGPAVMDDSGTDATNDTPTNTPIAAGPSITLDKMVDEMAVMEGAEVGDELTFSFTITNTGNLPLSNIIITDALPGVTITGGPITLAPLGIDTVTFEGTYPVTAADIAAGEVTNTATVTGQFGPDPADVVTDTDSVTATSGTLELSLIKTADVSALQTPVQPGDIITYAFSVTNTGTVPLSNVSVTDDLPGIVVSGDPIPLLAVGDTDDATFTATYAITQDDLDAGEVLNQATATGTSPIGGTAEDLSGTAADNDEPTMAPIVQAPSIDLVKEVDESTLLDGAVEGELLNYSFTVTNTGNVTLTNVTIVDALPGVVMTGGPIALAPGAVDSTTFTATYAVTLADITAGDVINTATASGQFGPDLADVVVDDDTVTAMVGTIEAISEVFPPLTDDGGTTTSMLASDLLNNEPATLDTVTITVINADPGVTLDPATGLITLAPGQPAGVYTVEYEIGSILVPTLTDTAIETVVQGPRPAIEVEKTQEFVDNGDGRDDVGDVVNYTLVVRNTGNMPLSGVILTDTLTDLNGAPLTLDSGPTFASSSAGSPEGELAFGETATYTASFTINLQAVNAGGVSNTVTSDAVPVYGPGVPEGPTSVTDVSDDGNDGDGDTESDPTQLLLAASVPEGGVSITKTTPLGIVQRGQIVPYTIVVSNDNPFVASPLTVVDRMPDGFLYVPDSATLDGAPVPVSLIGNIVTWEGLTVLGRGSITLTVQARILNGAHAGTHTNSVRVLDGDSGEALAPPATATVRILPDPVFDCGEVIGRVFNDLDGDGYQDAPTPDTGITDQTYYGDKGDVEEVVTPRTEHGIPNVRLATVDGTIITTDSNGLFSVPCAALPESGGSNFILKLDDRSLPAGFRVTSGNPRVVRLTPGMMTELNFGVAIGTVARVDLAGAAFYADGQGAAQMQTSLISGIDSLLASIDTNPTNVRLAFHVPANADAQTVSQARALMNIVENYIDDRWAAMGSFPLRVEQIIVRAEP